MEGRGGELEEEMERRLQLVGQNCEGPERNSWSF